MISDEIIGASRRLSARFRRLMAYVTSNYVNHLAIPSRVSHCGCAARKAIIPWAATQIFRTPSPVGQVGADHAALPLFLCNTSKDLPMDRLEFAYLVCDARDLLRYPPNPSWDPLSSISTKKGKNPCQHFAGSQSLSPLSGALSHSPHAATQPANAPFMVPEQASALLRFLKATCLPARLWVRQATFYIATTIPAAAEARRKSSCVDRGLGQRLFQSKMHRVGSAGRGIGWFDLRQSAAFKPPSFPYSKQGHVYV